MKVPFLRTGSLAMRRGDGSGARPSRRVHLAFASLLALAALWALGTSGASAAVKYPKLGEISGPVPGQAFTSLLPQSVAVDDANGHIYVADSGAHLVYDFSSAADTSPTVWNGSGTPAGSFGEGPIGVAADNSSGDVYVADAEHKLIDKFDSEGNLIASFGDTENELTHTPEPNGSLAGLKTPAASFAPSAFGIGIAVDQATHDLYAIDAGHQVIDVFSGEGAYLEQITATPEGLYGCGGNFAGAIAVNATSGHVLVADGCEEKVYEFTAIGEALEPWNGAGAPASFGGQVAVAVNDSSGDIYVSNTFPEAVVDQFSSAHAYLSQLARATGTGAGGVAVDQSSGHLLVSENAATSTVQIFGANPVLLSTVITAGATELGPHDATLNGTVNPEGLALSACVFEWGPTTAYGHSAECEPDAAAIGSGASAVEVKAHLTGLQAGTTYHFRLTATNANGTETGADESLATPPPPSIDAAEAGAITATSADLAAEVNPNGAETTCSFEYGATAEPGNPSVPFEHTVPCNPANLGSGHADVPVAAHLTGLIQNTTYHWRLTATNASGTTVGADHTFVFLAPGPEESCPQNEALRTGPSAALPDCRAYEQVTPTQKNGALTGHVLLGLPPFLAADGSRLELSAVQCFAAAVSCPASRGRVGSRFAFTRTAAGWTTTPLGPPATQFEDSTIWTSSPDARSTLFSAPTAPGGEDDFYIRAADGSITHIGPLTPPSAGLQNPTTDRISHATVDLTHVVFTDQHVIWPFDATAEEAESAYQVSGINIAEPFLVGVSGGPRSHDLVSTCGTQLSGHGINFLSADGGTVYFEPQGGPGCFGTGANAATEVPVNQLYARLDGETPAAETVHISQGQCSAGPDPAAVACRNAPPAVANFTGASKDGSLAYFTSTQQLTDEASEDSAADSALGAGCSVTTGPNGCNLYLYDFARPEGQRLIDVSAGDTSSEGPQVEGVTALSADGSHAYLVAKGVLAANPGAAVDPVTGQPQLARAGANNLYLYRRDAANPSGQTTFVAALSAGDIANWGSSNGPLAANLTPDGRFLVFTSTAALTPDSGDAGVPQVFRYDAHTGQLLRLSIGQRGFNDDGNAPASSVCVNAESQCPDAARIVEPSFFISAPGPLRTDPTMSDDGSRVFFQSPIGLTPAALDDVQTGTDEQGNPLYAQNVYEWQAEGAEVDSRISCTEPRGCVSLISDGRDTANLNAPGTCNPGSAVCLIGASTDGRNVFFTSADRLTTSDTDTQLDYYDARIDGGFPETAGITPCQTSEACHQGGTGPAAPQAHGTATFSGMEEGPGHPQVKCKKRFAKKHGRCVAKKSSKKKHHKKQKRANSDRGGGK